MGNKASYIHLRGSDLRPQFHQFTAVVSHPWGPQSPQPWPGQEGRGHSARQQGVKVLPPASWGSQTPLKLPYLCLCPVCVCSQPHPDVKPMAYASTLLQLGMM